MLYLFDTAAFILKSITDAAIANLTMRVITRRNASSEVWTGSHSILQEGGKEGTGHHRILQSLWERYHFMTVRGEVWIAFS